MTDIAIRVENPCPERSRRMSKQYPSAGSGQAASAALHFDRLSTSDWAQDRPAGTLQDDPRIADRGGGGTLSPSILRRPWSVVRRLQRDDLGAEGRFLRGLP